jgi:hypothetical protein
MKTIETAIKNAAYEDGGFDTLNYSYQDDLFCIFFSAEKDNDNDYEVEVTEFDYWANGKWIEAEPTPGQLIQMQKIINDKVAELMDNETRAANDAFTDLDREIQSNDFYNGK